MVHELKILPCYYDPVNDGLKNFEIRNNSDRGFQKGDTVLFREFNGSNYTERQLMASITYVTNYAQRRDYVVFGFSLIQ